jgi:FixJ family two-component response regulator
MRKTVDSLLRSVGLRTEVFESSDAFLKSKLPGAPSCLVLDVRLPGKSGLSIQSDLAAEGIDLPIIFISGHADVPMSVRAMKAGALEFLIKPFRDQDLLDAVEVALQRDRVRRADQKLSAELRARFETLTAREQQVMYLVCRRPAKQTDRCRTRDQRDDREDPSRSGFSQDAGSKPPRLGTNGRQIRDREYKT